MAITGFPFIYASSAPADPRLAPLSDIVPSCVFDLDATLEASYDGTGQLWKNLVPAPADGELQTAYDFLLGTSSSPSTDDPTFNGTAGSPAAYFSLDGGDFFQIAGGNTAFLNKIHRTTDGTPLTVIAAVKTPTSGIIHCIGSASATLNSLTCQWTSSATRMQMFQAGAVNGFGQSHTGGAANANNFLTYTKNAATDSIGMGANTSTLTSYSPAPNATSANLTEPLRIGFGGSGASANGLWFYSVAVFNEILDATAIAAVKAQLELRHERTY